MSKYNFELELNSNNSLALIIERIKPHSRVLEFGSAHGRLTKYLQEVLQCVVDIVEIDAEAGSEAARYASKSFLGETQGDIEKFVWFNELQHEQYDFIVFADVLEHLYSPEKVLKQCSLLLKDNGSILLSLPNVAHNSIILDLFNDEFKYNELGLLDNTHIRFFTYKSLLRLIESCGYIPVMQKATYAEVGKNEIANTYDSVERGFARYLRTRQMGNIYQYVLEIKNRTQTSMFPEQRIINFGKTHAYECVFYIKERLDEEFTERKTIRKLINPSHVSVQVTFDDYSPPVALRIDPLNANCVIRIEKLYTVVNNIPTEVPIAGFNGMKTYDNTYIFFTHDPQIIIDLDSITIDNLHFEYHIFDYDSNSIELLETPLYNYAQLIQETNKKLAETCHDLNQARCDLNQIQHELENSRQELEQTRNEVVQIYLSRSWRFTRPFRKLMNKLRHKV